MDILPRYVQQLKHSHLLGEASFSPKTEAVQHYELLPYSRVVLEMAGDPQLYKADTTFHAT